MIAVQLIDRAGRVLGSLRLPSNLSLADLERLAFAADSPPLPTKLADTSNGIAIERKRRQAIKREG